MKPFKIISPSLHHQSAVTFGGLVFLQAVNFVVLMLLAHTLSPAEVGRYQLFFSITVVLSMITKCGMDEGLSYYLPVLSRKNPRQVISVITVAILFGLGLSILVAGGVNGLAPLAGKFLFRLSGFEGDLKYLFFALPAFTFSFLALSGLRGIERSDIRGYIYYFFMSGGMLLGLIILRLGQLQLADVILLRAGIFALGGSIAFFFLWRLTKHCWVLPSRGDIREFQRFSIALVFVGLLQYLVEMPLIDLAIVSHVASAEAVGLYAIASRVGALGLISFTVMTVVIAPRIAVAVSSDVQQSIKIYQLTSKWLIRLSAFSTGLFFLLAEDILHMFGEQYLAAKNILLIFAGGYFVMASLGLNLPFMLSLKKQKQELVVGSICIALMVSGGILGGQLLGPPGVAMATIISLCIANGIRLMLLKRSLALPSPISRSSFFVLSQVFLLAVVLNKISRMEIMHPDVPAIHVVSVFILFSSLFMVIIGVDEGWFRRKI